MSDPSAEARYTLSIDTGGTFTDGFVSSAARQAQVKVDTTPHDLTVGFRECVAAAAEAVDESLGDFLGRADVIHFSSTIATNTAVQRSGPQVGLITTADRDEALHGTPGEARALAAFLPEELVIGVGERVSPEGLVEVAPDAAEVEAAVRTLLERGVRVLVVSFPRAHLNPANERAARDIITASYPRHYLGAIPLLQASQISLAEDDFGRTATAVLNAYLHPALVRSLYRAEDGLRSAGFARPLLIVNTDGSSTRVAKTRAIDTFNSGPSAGVLGAAMVAEELGAAEVCTFDVGGTTTDVAHISGADAPRTPTTAAGPLTVPHPAVDLWSFGLGGGSIIRREDGALRVGPESAGSAPGPACFGLGGELLTPTDVWLALGYIDPDAFLGGRRVLQVDRAREAVATVGAGSSDDLEETALDALDAVHAALADGVRSWAAGRSGLLSGEDRWLFSYGGGGGLLCAAAADALGITRVVVFPNSSVFSAFGGGLLPIAHHYRASLGPARNGALSALVGSLADAARRDLRAEGVRDLDHVVAQVAVVGAGDRSLSAEGASLSAVLDGIALPDVPDDATRVELRVEVPRPRGLAVRTAAHSEEGRRTVITREGPRELPIAPGLGEAGAAPVTGPAFLAARDTTILVPDGWSCRFTDLGYGVIEKGGSHR